MSRVSLTQHTTFVHFSLGDLEDFVKKARKDLSRDCILNFPMDSRLWSDSHGLAESLTITCDTQSTEVHDCQEAYIDIDFGRGAA